MTQPMTVWTIGHSTRTLEQFINVLRHHQIEAIADVRRFPGSRRLPQFGENALREALAAHGVHYCWIEELGGRRRPVKDSTNLAWRNSSFQGYADHLQSAEFQRGLQCLLQMAANERTAMMCAEVLWWRCHRSLVSDVLKTRGIEVLHIQDEKPPAPHPFTAPARLIGGQLSYAASGGESLRKEIGSGQIDLDL